MRCFLICRSGRLRATWLRGAVLAVAALAPLPSPPTRAETPPATAPLVVAADGVLCDLTRSLSADQARVVCLIPAGTDPHQAVLRPRDRQALAEAQLVLRNGYNLTPALEGLNLRAPQVAVAEQAVPASPGRDPHVWQDSRHAAAMVQVVEDRLVALLPAQATPGIRRRSHAARDVLQALGVWTGAQIRTVPEAHRVLVSEHRAFSTLARRYGLRELPLRASFSSGGVLRPSGLAAMVRAVRESGTRQLFAESAPPTKTLRRVSRSSGVPLNPTPLVADGLAPGRSWVQTATANVCTVVNGQGGHCDSAGAERLAQRWQAVR